MLSDFIKYLNSRVGISPYVWGAQGQSFWSYEALFAFIERHETGNDRKRALAYAKKLQDAGVPIENIQVFDCSGYGMYYLQNKTGLYKHDMSANGMYGQCTPIKKSELCVGDWVFRGGSGRKYHVGYVTEIKNGVPWINECKGRDDGVIKAPLKGSYWNAFGRPKIFEDEINETLTGDELRLARELSYGSKGADVLWVQRRLKELGFFKGVPKGNFKALTKAAVLAFQKAVFPNDRDEWDSVVGEHTIVKLGGVWVGRS